MRPGLEPGDEVLVYPGAYRWRSPRPGQVVLARHPWRTDVLLIKRIERVEHSGALFLRGDNPEGAASTDSRSFGAVPRSHLLGRVVARLPRAPGEGLAPVPAPPR